MDTISVYVVYMNVFASAATLSVAWLMAKIIILRVSKRAFKFCDVLVDFMAQNKVNN